MLLHFYFYKLYERKWEAAFLKIGSHIDKGLGVRGTKLPKFPIIFQKLRFTGPPAFSNFFDDLDSLESFESYYGQYNWQ